MNYNLIQKKKSKFDHKQFKLKIINRLKMVKLYILFSNQQPYLREIIKKCNEQRLYWCL